MILTFGCSKKTATRVGNTDVDGRVETNIEEKGGNDDEEIIIEGTVIAANRGFCDRTILSSCLVEVNAVYKGGIEKK